MARFPAGQKTVSARGKGSPLLVVRASKKERKPLAPHKSEPAPPDKSLRHPSSALCPPGGWVRTPREPPVETSCSIGLLSRSAQARDTHDFIRFAQLLTRTDVFRAK
ncbi:hypothetical protein MTO96_034277 [Rhipicephalus appendiculatus]